MESMCQSRLLQLWPVEGNPLRSTFSGRNCSPWGICGGAAVSEGLHPVERTHVGGVHQGLYLVGGTPCWSRGRR